MTKESGVQAGSPFWHADVRVYCVPAAGRENYSSNTKLKSMLEFKHGARVCSCVRCRSPIEFKRSGQAEPGDTRQGLPEWVGSKFSNKHGRPGIRSASSL